MIEREIFGANADVRLGLSEDGRFETSGERFRTYLCAADAVVVHRARLTRELVTALAATGRCRVVARQGVGTDNIDVQALRDLGIASFHVPDYCTAETADHALALVLALDRDICAQDRMIRRGHWSTRVGRIPRRLGRRTLGIIGFGRIGSTVARKASVFFGEILAYDPEVHSDAVEAHGARAVDSLEELASCSDVLTLHASLNTNNYGLINREFLRNTREGALLVNTARGPLVDSDAVLEALETGALSGYATDVYAPENPADNASNALLARHERVVSTSHRGFLSQESEVSLRRRVATEVAYVLRTGQAPRYGRLS
ncbi:C-terminal binding protein [Streptomyces nigra]|uniref:C-terminal binding protein n=1 Tax=Streptomyces nigra TaxID=1827580 RepID=UPI00365F20E4